MVRRFTDLHDFGYKSPMSLVEVIKGSKTEVEWWDDEKVMTWLKSKEKDQPVVRMCEMFVILIFSFAHFILTHYHRKRRIKK